MNKDWVQRGGQLSDTMRQALGAGEEVLFYQRSVLGSDCAAKIISWCLGIAALLVGVILAQNEGTPETEMYYFLPAVAVALLFFISPFLAGSNEYAVTHTRVIIGRRAWRWGGFSYDVVPIDMISGVKIQSSGGSSTLAIQHAGGTVNIPVMAGKGGKDLTLHLTRLLEERRTFSAHHQAEAIAPPPPATAAPPSAAPMDKQTRLEMLRDRLVQGQISEDTYNRLRKEIEDG